MEKSLLNFKLFRLLSALTSKEYNALRRMAESDFFKTDAKTSVLLKMLKPHHPNFDTPQLSKEFLHKKLFKKQQYKDKTMHDLFYSAAALTEEFLLHEELKSNQRKRKKQLRDIYRKRLLFKEFDLAADKLIARLENKSTRESIDFFELWEIADFHYFTPQTDQIATRMDYFKLTMNALDRFYAFHKFRYQGELMINKKLLGFKESSLFANQWSTLNTSKSPFHKTPIFSILQNTTRLIAEPNNLENYHQLKEMLVDNSERLTHDQQQSVLIQLLNFCFQQINFQDFEWYKEANSLYKFGVPRSLFETESYLRHFTFINIVDTAVEVKDFTWAKDFIKTYQTILFPKNTEQTIYFSQALYHFGKGNFTKALQHLLRYQPTNQIMRLRADFRLIRTYFELLDVSQEHDEDFRKATENLERYLNRHNEIPDYNRQPYLGAIRGMKLLYRLRNNPNLSSEDKKTTLRHFLDDNKCAGIRWFCTKMEVI